MLCFGGAFSSCEQLFNGTTKHLYIFIIAQVDK